MSSFRIDRQYVSFVTAETRSVRTAGQMPDTNMFFTDTGAANESEEVMAQHYAEILDRARKEAEEKAALILKRARSEADAIVGQAKRMAGDTMEEARSSAAGIRAEAKQAGYSEGQKTAQMHAQARKKEEKQEFSQLMDQLRSHYSELVEGMREDVISLVIDIVKKIVNFRLNESDEIFLGLIRDALEQLKQTGTVIIRVGSEDYARYFGTEAGKGIQTGKAKAAVLEEESYSPGDLIVESEGEILDYSIGRQIERVEKAFLKERAETGGCR